MNVDYLNQIALSYHINTDISDKFIEDLSQKFFCDWISSFFSNNLSCCEMGYGDGVTTSILSNYFKNYSVIEGSSKLVEFAKNRHPKINIVCDLFENIKFNEKYDLILALHVLEHVDNPVLMLKTIKTWLNLNGQVVILVPNRNSLHRIFAHGMGLIPATDTLSNRDHQVGHKRVYDFESLQADVVDAGFNIDFKKGFFLKPLPNSMMINFDPKLILEFNKASSLISDFYLANICIVASVK